MPIYRPNHQLENLTHFLWHYGVDPTTCSPNCFPHDFHADVGSPGGSLSRPESYQSKARHEHHGRSRQSRSHAASVSQGEEKRGSCCASSVLEPESGRRAIMKIEEGDLGACLLAGLLCFEKSREKCQLRIQNCANLAMLFQKPAGGFAFGQIAKTPPRSRCASKLCVVSRNGVRQVHLEGDTRVKIQLEEKRRGLKHTNQQGSWLNKK